jgi:hypothetical protein
VTALKPLPSAPDDPDHRLPTELFSPAPLPYPRGSFVSRFAARGPTLVPVPDGEVWPPTYEPVFPVSVGDVWVIPAVPFGFPVESLPVTANAALANPTDTMAAKPSVCTEFIIQVLLFIR